MSLAELIALVSPGITVLAAVLRLSYRLGQQDKALEFLMRRAEDTYHKEGSVPPPRPKLATLSEEHNAKSE